MVLRQLAVSLAVLGAIFVACTRVEVAPPPMSALPGEGGAAGESAGGGAPALAGAAGMGGEEAQSGSGSGPGPREFSVWPTFARDPSRSYDVQAVSASVAALSAGAETLPLFERWDALSGASGSPLSATWNRWNAMVQPYRERGGTLSLCLGVVDRAERAWPFAGELDSEAARSAMERTVDEAFTHYGGVLTHLCFGYELDRYWQVASARERRTLTDFLRQAVDYASGHPLRSPRTAIGVALSLGAFTGERDVPLADFALGDELLGVYDPLGPGGELKKPEAVASELDSALETIAALPGPSIPFALIEAGYPSADEAGSSEAAQLAYFESLFAALDEHREQVSLVGVFGLGDRAAEECEAEAAVFGGKRAVQAARAAARCSMGLRAEAGGGDKLAWEQILAAVSRHR